MNHKAPLWSYLIPNPWVIPLIPLESSLLLIMAREWSDRCFDRWLMLLNCMASWDLKNSIQSREITMFFPPQLIILLSISCHYHLLNFEIWVWNKSISINQNIIVVVLNSKDSNLALRGRLQGTESRMQVPDAGSASSTMTKGLSSSVTTRRCWASSGGLRNGP